MQSIRPEYHSGLFPIRSTADGPGTGLFPVPLSFSRSEEDSDEWPHSGGSHAPWISGYTEGEASGHHENETWGSQLRYPLEQPPPQYQLPLPTTNSSTEQQYPSQHRLPVSPTPH